MILAIYIVFFFFLYKYYSKKNYRLTHFLALIYLISAIGALYLYTCSDLFLEVKLNIWAILFHCSMYGILFLAISTIEKGCKPINEIKFPVKAFKILFYILLVSSAISFYDSILTLKSTNIFESQAIGERRFDLSQGNLVTTSNPLLEYIKGPSSILNSFKISLFFLSFILFKKYRTFGIILLICSLTSVVQNLTISGRNAIAQWLILILLNYIYFKPYLSDKFKKNFNRISILLLPIIILPTVIITIARFSADSKGLISGIFDTSEDVLSYFSQGLINFSDFFSYFTWPKVFGKSCLPILFGQIEQYRLNESIYIDAPFAINSFSTMIGSFVMDFGLIGTSIFVFMHLLVAKMLVKIMKKDKTILSLIIMLLCFEVMSMGIFYFMYFSPMFQKVFIALIIALYLKTKKFKPKSEPIKV